MFGQNNNQQQDDQGQVNTVQPTEASTAPTVTGGDDAAAGAAPATDGSFGDNGQAAPTNDVNLELPASPQSAAPQDDNDFSSSVTGSSVSAAPDDLLQLKQDALQQLSPLVGHLEQTPEERFRTTMMMIQATDDHTKIKDAYDAAQQITDEKVRAQALLDVVNEINYFTQQHNKES